MLQYKPRAEDRTNVMLRARLRDRGPERDACIVDVSSRGLAATVDDPPCRGDYVELVVGDIVLVGQVKWSSIRRFGMVFRERISVLGLMSGEGGPVALKARETVRKQKARKAYFADGAKLAKKVEYGMLFAAGLAATLVLTDFANDALHSMSQAQAALARSNGG